MLLAQYEKAKTLAKFGSPQKFAEMDKTYDRWQMIMALAMIAGIAVFFAGERIFGQFLDPAGLPYRLCTVLLPALMVVTGYFGSDRIRMKREIVVLARRLQKDVDPMKEGE